MLTLNLLRINLKNKNPDEVPKTDLKPELLKTEDAKVLSYQDVYVVLNPTKLKKYPNQLYE